MVELDMTLSCDNVAGVHARPSTSIGMVSKMFPQTNICIVRPGEPAPVVLDTRSTISLMMANLTDGEELVVQANGKDEDLAAIAMKAVCEKLKTIHSGSTSNSINGELFRAIESALLKTGDPRGHGLIKAAAAITKQHVVKKGIVEIGDRFHTLSARLLPFFAKHFACMVILMYEAESGEIIHVRIPADALDDPTDQTVLQILCDPPAPDSKITIHCEGDEREEAFQVVSRFLIHLRACDAWIRGRYACRGFDEAIVNWVRTLPVHPAMSPGPRAFALSQEIDSDRVHLARGVHDQGEALTKLAGLLAAYRPQLSAQVIMEQTYPVILCPDIALPHARMHTAPAFLSLAIGVFPEGVVWDDGSKVRIVMFSIYPPDAPATYKNYLSHTATLFNEEENLAQRLCKCQTSEEVCATLAQLEKSRA